MEDKLILIKVKNFLFINTEFFFCIIFATHQHFEQRGATGRLNLDFFQNHLKP